MLVYERLIVLSLGNDLPFHLACENHVALAQKDVVVAGTKPYNFGTNV